MKNITLYPMLLVLFIAGCSDDSTTATPGDSLDLPAGYVTATTPTALVSNLELAFKQRDIAVFDRVLHEDFVFYFAPQDEFLSPGGLGLWDYASEVASTRNMFSGAPGLRRIYDDTGALIDSVDVPGVQRIVMNLDPREDWQTWPHFQNDGQEFSGADWRRTYDANLTVTFVDGESITVRGQQRLYLKQVEVEDGDTLTEIYQLYAWKDFGVIQRRASNPESWGVLKSLYQ